MSEFKVAVAFKAAPKRLRYGIDPMLIPVTVPEAGDNIVVDSVLIALLLCIKLALSAILSSKSTGFMHFGSPSWCTIS